MTEELTAKMNALLGQQMMLEELEHIYNQMEIPAEQDELTEAYSRCREAILLGKLYSDWNNASTIWRFVFHFLINFWSFLGDIWKKYVKMLDKGKPEPVTQQPTSPAEQSLKKHGETGKKKLQVPALAIFVFWFWLSPILFSSDVNEEPEAPVPMEPKSPEVQAKSSVGKKKSPGKAGTKVGKLPAIVADSNSDREIIPAGVRKSGKCWCLQFSFIYFC